MAPKSNSADHWQMEDLKTNNDSDDDDLQIVEDEVKLEIENDSTDDDLEIINEYNTNVMDFTTTDLDPLRRKSNIFNSSHVPQRMQLLPGGDINSPNKIKDTLRPGQISRLKSEAETEVDSLNQYVEQMDIDEGPD